MKFFLIFILTAFLLPSFTFAKNGEPDTEALYVVPSPPELVAHSRFIVKIVTPFKGPETQMISYVFPEVLIGEKDRLIKFYRIEGTENSWKSDLLTAHCTVLDDIFSCNVHVNKSEEQSYVEFLQSLFVPKAHAAIGQLCQGHALSHLSNMDLSQQDFDGFTGVVHRFCAGEPAGIFSYEFQ